MPSRIILPATNRDCQKSGCRSPPSTAAGTELSPGRPVSIRFTTMWTMSRWTPPISAWATVPTSTGSSPAVWRAQLAGAEGCSGIQVADPGLHLRVFEDLDHLAHPLGGAGGIGGLVADGLGHHTHQVDHAVLGNHLDLARVYGFIRHQLALHLGGQPGVIAAGQQRADALNLQLVVNLAHTAEVAGGIPRQGAHLPVGHLAG